MLVLLAPVSACKHQHHRPPAARARDVQGLSAIPAGVRVVVGADVRKLAAAPLAQRAVSEMLARDPGLRERVRAITTDCKLDLRTDLTQVVVGMGKSQNDVVLVAEGHFSESHLVACVGESLHSVGGRVVTQQIDGRAAYHAEGNGKANDVWFALGSPKTLVVTTTRDWLSRALSGGKKVVDDAAMTALVNRAGPGATLWMAGTVQPNVGQGLVQTTGGKVKKPPRAVFGHLDLSGPVDAELGVVMASTADAKAAVSFAKPQLDTLALVAQKFRLGRIVEKISVARKRDTVILRLRLTKAEVASAISPIDTRGPADENPGPSAHKPVGHAARDNAAASPGRPAGKQTNKSPGGPGHKR